MGKKCYGQNTASTHRLTGRPVTGGGGARAGILVLFTFFCFLKTSTLQLGMVEHLKIRQKCHKNENHYFPFIHKIKKIIPSDLIIQIHNQNSRLIMEIDVVLNEISDNFYFDYKAVQSNLINLLFFQSYE